MNSTEKKEIVVTVRFSAPQVQRLQNYKASLGASASSLSLAGLVRDLSVVGLREVEALEEQMRLSPKKEQLRGKAVRK